MRTGEGNWKTKVTEAREGEQGAPMALAGAECQSVWQDGEEWTEKCGKTSAALKSSGLERRPSLGDDRQR